MSGPSRVVPLDRTGDRRIDGALRRLADVTSREATPPSALVAGADGTVTIAARVTTRGSESAPYAREREIIGSVATLDATQATVAEMQLSEGSAAALTTVFVGRKVAGGDVYRVTLAGTYKRDPGGAPTVVATTTVIAGEIDGGAAAWSVDYDVAGDRVRARVTGAAATQIRWACVMRALEVA